MRDLGNLREEALTCEVEFFRAKESWSLFCTDSCYLYMKELSINNLVLHEVIGMICDAAESHISADHYNPFIMMLVKSTMQSLQTMLLFQSIMHC